MDETSADFKRPPVAQLRGLAPSDPEAADWLALQRDFAWSPELLAVRLSAGALPAEWVRGRRLPEQEIRQLTRLGVRIVPRGHAVFPDRLAAIPDPPPVLLVRGQPTCLGSTGVAIVGARAATETARRATRRLARELAAAGVTVISGLARGIDAEAHQGALEAEGTTIAVLACGPDQIYPPEHRRLADAIMERGAVVTEMPLGTSPRRAHFPLRNRLISGLSLGVVVAEARQRSGSLITVRHALNQGREVFVLPGSVEGPFAAGSNALLRDGARSVACAREVMEDLGIEPLPTLPLAAPPRSSQSEPAVSVDASAPGANAAVARIVAALEASPITRQGLAEGLGLGPGELARALLELELAGRIVEDRDGRLQLNWHT